MANLHCHTLCHSVWLLAFSCKKIHLIKDYWKCLSFIQWYNFVCHHSSLKVLKATVKRLKFGLTRSPASLTVIPLIKTWATRVAWISSETACLLALPPPPPPPYPSSISSFMSFWIHCSKTQWTDLGSFIYWRFWLMCVKFWLLVFPRG